MFRGTDIHQRAIDAAALAPSRPYHRPPVTGVHTNLAVLRMVGRDQYERLKGSKGH